MTGTTTSRTPAVGTSVGSGTMSDSGGSVGATAKDAVGTAAEKAKGAGSELTHMAQEQVDEARHRVIDQADRRRSDFADAAHSVEAKLREFATSVGEEQPKVGEVLEQVTDAAGRLVSYVERTPVERMGQDLSDQMRRRPGLFAAGMFGIGFALSRVIKPVGSRTTIDGGMH